MNEAPAQETEEIQQSREPLSHHAWEGEEVFKGGILMKQ